MIRAQIIKVGDEEELIITSFVGYDANLHVRPADFEPGLENVDDPDLEPLSHEPGSRAERYAQWLDQVRPPADAVPFTLSTSGMSFDVNYGVILGVEYEDGRKYVGAACAATACAAVARAAGGGTATALTALALAHCY